MQNLNCGPLKFPRGISLLEFMRKAESRTGNYPFFFDEFSGCHHCKLLFHKSRMIKCNYSSSTMGLPAFNKNSKPFYNLNSNQLLRKTIRKRPSDEKKRHTQQKTKAEIHCDRFFCRMCIKINYETNVEVASRKTDWICPFCTGVCFCSRCLRNDLMNRVKNLYVSTGEKAKIEDLDSKSLFNQFVEPSFQNSVLKLNNLDYFSGKKPPSFSSLKEKSERITEEKEKLDLSYKKYIEATKFSSTLELMKLILETIEKREQLKLEIVSLNDRLVEKIQKRKMASSITKNISLELQKLEGSTNTSNSSQESSETLLKKPISKPKSRLLFPSISSQTRSQLAIASLAKRKREKLADLNEKTELMKKVKGLLMGRQADYHEAMDGRKSKDIDKLIHGLNKNYLKSLMSDLLADSRRR